MGAARSAGALLPAALASVRKGGSVVLGGIHMSEIPAMPYTLLWRARGEVRRRLAKLGSPDPS